MKDANQPILMPVPAPGVRDFSGATKFAPLASRKASLPQPPAGRTLTINGGDVVGLDKADVGLGQVDNTSDAAKPLSLAQAAAGRALSAGSVFRRGPGPRASGVRVTGPRPGGRRGRPQAPA